MSLPIDVVRTAEPGIRFRWYSMGVPCEGHLGPSVEKAVAELIGMYKAQLQSNLELVARIEELEKTLDTTKK